MDEPRVRLIASVIQGEMWWLADDGSRRFIVPLASDSDDDVEDALGRLIELAGKSGMSPGDLTR